MSGLEIVIAVVIAIGLIGIVVPVLPGDWLVLIAVLVWASETEGVTAWTVAGVAAALIVLGAVIKYAVPGRKLKVAGVPTRSILLGAVLGVVGFFVIPVVGLVIGFVLGIFISERLRLRDGAAARQSTVHALKAVGLAMLIEFCFALLAAITWGIGVVLT